MRRLLAYYRTSEPVLPQWIEAFAKTGYAHYCTLLPTAFADEQATKARSRRPSASSSAWRGSRCRWAATGRSWSWRSPSPDPQEPAKRALLWAAQVHLGRLSRAELRSRCDELLGNPLLLPVYPRYLSGFVQALEPVPGLADFVVEAVSNAFARLPDPVLLPWLPTLITALRADGAELGAAAGGAGGGADLPRPACGAGCLGAAVAGGRARAGGRGPARTDRGRRAALLAAHPAACDAVADLLGCDGTWSTADPVPPGAELLGRHPETATALEALLAAR